MSEKIISEIETNCPCCFVEHVAIYNNLEAEAAEARATTAERERDEARAQLATAQAERDAAIKSLTEIEQRTTYLDKNVNASGDEQIASAWDIAHKALKAMKP